VRGISRRSGDVECCMALAFAFSKVEMGIASFHDLTSGIGGVFRFVTVWLRLFGFLDCTCTADIRIIVHCIFHLVHRFLLPVLAPSIPLPIKNLQTPLRSRHNIQRLDAYPIFLA
jgi:hypothetical protein